jgi:DNA polymerase III subunit delta'
MIHGQIRAVEQFTSAWQSGNMHHAWLLAGPRGVGKAAFAQAAVRRILAEAAGPRADLPGLETPADHPMVRLLDAGSHPDFRMLERLERPTGGLARNISVDQVRTLAPLFGSTPFMSAWRAVIVDSADDLEAPAANALLKMLEEPPANCLFLLISHTPGRLLPTIRSRCRKLDFAPLNDDAMTSVMMEQLPSINSAERARLIASAEGSPGRALAFAALDLAPLEQEVLTILRQGDPTNARRSKLAQSLGLKAAADRYAAFLDLVPSLIAREARSLSGAQRDRALDAYARARQASALAPRLSLDPAATAFQLGSILASVADPASLKR